MKVFRTDRNEGLFQFESPKARGMFILENNEIQKNATCRNYKVVGTTWKTSCTSEGCYSLENKNSTFVSDMIHFFCKKFSLAEKRFRSIFIENTQSSLVECLKKEVKKDLDFDALVTAYRTLNEVHREGVYFFPGYNWEEIKIISYVKTNDLTTSAPPLYTRKDENEFYNRTWEDITSSQEGKEVIEDYNTTDDRIYIESGVFYVGKEYLFFKEKVNTTGCRVERILK